jgi:hypothetical protein
MDLQDLINFAKPNMVMYPQIESSIQDVVDMARHEIWDGGSENHEVELAINSINEMIVDVFQEFEDFSK